MWTTYTKNYTRVMMWPLLLQPWCHRMASYRICVQSRLGCVSMTARQKAPPQSTCIQPESTVRVKKNATICKICVPLFDKKMRHTFMVCAGSTGIWNCSTHGGRKAAHMAPCFQVPLQCVCCILFDVYCMRSDLCQK